MIDTEGLVKEFNENHDEMRWCRFRGLMGAADKMRIAEDVMIATLAYMGLEFEFAEGVYKATGIRCKID